MESRAQAKTHRSLVVSIHASRGAQDEVAAALATDKRLQVELVDGDHGAVSACAAVVFVSGGDDFDLLLRHVEDWRRVWPSAAVVVAIGLLDDGRFARLLAAGIHDFVTLPLQPGELLARMRRALSLVSAEVETTRPGVHPRLQDFIGCHPSFMAQVNKLPALAGCDASVLVLGETGTGKEVCAQAIHYLSARASQPWVAINCGAMPAELVEDELFGHVKGAYTTAHAPRNGLVREAEGGTLFLDDVDCLPLSAQVKLLRFVQEREYRAIGSNHVQHADVRIVAAGNLRLPQMVARGEFRQDLYFRLNVLALNMPALRERADDIPALAEHFLQRFSERHGRRVQMLSPGAIDKLMAYGWPGNVRELQHAMERAVLLAPGPVLSADDFEVGTAPASRGGGTAGATFRSAKAHVVREFERGYIERLLASCGGNVTQAAQQAGKNRRAFFELMRKHQISASRFRAEPGSAGR